jgi:signal transduction histidine kinase
VWTLETQLALVAIVVAGASTAALLLRSRRPLYARFGAFAISVATYYVTALLTSVISTAAVLASARILAGSAVVITAALFFDAILGEAGVRARERRRKTYVAAVAMALVGVTPLAQQLWVQAVVAAVALLLLGARANAVLRRANEVESAAERTRLRYLAYGGFIALLGFCSDLAAQMGWPVPPLGGAFVAVYLYFISQALLLSRLLDLHELLGKALVFTTLALILAVVYGVLLVWVGERRGLFLFNTLVASSLILILFEPMKTYLEETTTRLFFREHVTFARTMRALSRRIATIIELPRAVDSVLDEIYDLKRATHCSLYFLESDRMGLVLQSFRGPQPVAHVDSRSLPALFAHIMKTRTPLLRDSVERRLASAASSAGEALPEEGEDTEKKNGDADKAREPVGPAHDEALLAGLDALKADLVVPMRSSEDVVGLLCLRDERLSEAYASDEIAALMQVGEQLAVNVSNSRLFGLLRERDRLATLGEMSAGLAHEIRNPLAAIKGAAQELDPRNPNEGDGEMMEIIIDEVNRLNTVVSSFLDYARPFRGTFSSIGPNVCVKRCVQLMERALGDEIEVELDLADDLPDMNGDAEQIQQVLINLMLNAAEAMSHEGKIEVSTRPASDLRDAALLGLRDEASFVEIRVRDYGPGIAKSVRENLFIPFFTTKSRGTGLGLPLCQRIVQHHGGAIEVHSVEGRGATFVVRLPALVRRSLPPREPAEEQPAEEQPAEEQPAGQPPEVETPEPAPVAARDDEASSAHDAPPLDGDEATAGTGDVA